MHPSWVLYKKEWESVGYSKWTEHKVVMVTGCNTWSGYIWDSNQDGSRGSKKCPVYQITESILEGILASHPGCSPSPSSPEPGYEANCICVGMRVKRRNELLTIYSDLSVTFCGTGASGWSTENITNPVYIDTDHPKIYHYWVRLTWFVALSDEGRNPHFHGHQISFGDTRQGRMELIKD